MAISVARLRRSTKTLRIQARVFQVAVQNRTPSNVAERNTRVLYLSGRLCPRSKAMYARQFRQTPDCEFRLGQLPSRTAGFPDCSLDISPKLFRGIRAGEVGHVAQIAEGPL